MASLKTRASLLRNANPTGLSPYFYTQRRARKKERLKQASTPTLRGSVVVVGRGVVNVIESRDEVDFNSAELGFENAEVRPWVVGFVCWRNSPQVVPLVAQRFRFAHDLEMKKVGSHNVPVSVA